MLKRKAYEHVPFVDPDKDIGKAIGWLFRYRGLAVQMSIDLVGIGVTFWLSGNWVLIGSVVIVCLAVLFTSFGVRLVRLKIVRLGQNFHAVAHLIRDVSKKLPGALARAGDDLTAYDAEYMAWNQEVADRIARFFETLIGERSVGCAIRCASGVGGRGHSFVTIARSQEMWKDKREVQSKPIPEDTGVARVLRQKDRYGVFFVWDIAEARKNEDVWYRTPTDDLPDVKQVMVAPINGYIRGDREMLGLLYVTTRRRQLRINWAVHLMGFADMLGLVWPLVTREGS